MVKLSGIFIITIGASTVFLSLCMLFMLLICRILCSKIKIFMHFAKLKIRYIILITIAGSILLFFSMAAIYKITSTIEIASIKSDLKTCTSLRAQYTFGDPKTYKIVSEDITIEDSNVLGQLAALMANVKYERWRGGGYLAALDKMDIILYKNGLPIRQIRIVAVNFLETNNTYRCSDSSLAEKIRKILAHAAD